MRKVIDIRVIDVNNALVLQKEMCVLVKQGFELKD